jgi:hypothetical protein
MPSGSEQGASLDTDRSAIHFVLLWLFFPFSQSTVLKNPVCTKLTIEKLKEIVERFLYLN